MKTQCNNKTFLGKLLQKIIVVSLLVTASSLCFIAGNYSTNSQVEVCSGFFTSLTKNHTRSKMYSALVVEEKKESDQKLLGTADEFYRLYGSFRQDRACFANTYNLNKESSIILNNTEISDLSLLFTSSGLELEYDEKTGWRHDFYPLEMMFDAPKSERPGTKGGYCFISQTQAEALLNSNYMGFNSSEPYDKADYQQLQYKEISLTCNGDSMNYCILSIFYERGYYFDALKEVMGDFIFTYGGVPGNLSKQAVYFMRDYTFQNEYYINYVKQQYNDKDFNYIIGTFNVIDDFYNHINLTGTIFGKKNDSISIVLFLISIFISLSLMIYISLTNYGEYLLDILLFYLTAFIPFLFFKIFSNITESSHWFTGVSTQFNMWLLIVLFCLFPLIVLFKKSKKKEPNYE